MKTSVEFTSTEKENYRKIRITKRKEHYWMHSRRKKNK
jgi:hypothetical protein